MVLAEGQHTTAPASAAVVDDLGVVEDRVRRREPRATVLSGDEVDLQAGAAGLNGRLVVAIDESPKEGSRDCGARVVKVRAANRTP
jgi:hypothetical protein